MTEYGEVLHLRRWHSRIDMKGATFRYRIDPVPGIHKNSGCFGAWYKTGSTVPEQRMTYPHEGYVRAKRSKRNLFKPWDDHQRGDRRTRKSWKSKKIRKQWEKYIVL